MPSCTSPTERAYMAATYYMVAASFSMLTSWPWWLDVIAIYLGTLVLVYLFDKAARRG